MVEWAISPGERGARAGRWLVALLALCAALASFRPSPSPPRILVEVAGAVPRPGLWPVDPPTAGAALAAAGVTSTDPTPVRDGDRLVWDGAVLRVEAPSDPLLFGRRVDVETAPAAALAALPGVSPDLAAAIVADREARGPFGSVDALDRVRGVGPHALGLLRAGAFASVQGPPAPPPLIDLNRADAAALESLPGIGPALAARILEDRARNGRYRGAADLDRVKGIGPGILRRLRGRVRVGP